MKKLQKSYKSNTRIYDDGSIEVDPQAQDSQQTGEAMQATTIYVDKINMM